MIKKELRKLRALYATPEMIEKAKKNDIEAEIKEHWGTKTVKRKYGMFLRCQNLGGYLKVAVYIPKDLQKGKKEPTFEIFINPEGNDFITRYFRKGEEKWSTARISNLPSVGSFNSNYWDYMYHCEKRAWINAEGKKTIKTLLGVSQGGYEGIEQWQQKVQTDKIKEAEARELAPWDEDMARVPDVLDGFLDWCRKEVVQEHHIFYEYKKGGAKSGYCSYCEKEVPIVAPAHRKDGKCPVCHKKITFIAEGRMSRLESRTYDAFLLQRTTDKKALVVRRFHVSRAYKTKNSRMPSYSVWETNRTIHEKGRPRAYAYTSYKNKYMRWCREMIGGYPYYRSGVVYRKNMPELARTVLKKSALPLMVKRIKEFEVDKWLWTEEGNPALEKAAKAGLWRLAMDLYECGYDSHLLNESAGELAKMLKIDNARLDRIKKADAGLDYLEWMQAEKVANTVWSEDMIGFFVKYEYTPDDLKFISDRMSYLKIYNYLLKQKKLHTENIPQLITTWSDYLNMAKKLKMQMDLEYIYKPKHLKKAHDEAVLLLKEKDTELEAEKRAKQFPKCNEVLQTLGKYEYEDKNYAIVVPKSIKDIILEGKILNHCVHTVDYYYDRISQQTSYLLFLRKAESKDTPWYTLEVEPGGNIRQKRTTGDCQREDLQEAMPFLKKWQKVIQKRLSKEEKELAKKSEQARLKEYEKLRKDGNLIRRGKLAGKLLADVLEEDFMAAEAV